MHAYVITRIVRDKQTFEVLTEAVVAVCRTERNAQRSVGKLFKRSQAAGEKTWLEGGDEWTVSYRYEEFKLLA